MPTRSGIRPALGRPRLPLHATATGPLLLAHASEARQVEVCAGPLDALTPSTIADGVALKHCLAKIRREGYAVTHGTLAQHLGSVAFPVRNTRGTVVASVGVVAATGSFQPMKPASFVLAAADAVSRHVRSAGCRIAQVEA
ncbi:IclR family transcriptional regulator domain-containing protein [Streptomyces sp. NPDC002845]